MLSRLLLGSLVSLLSCLSVRAEPAKKAPPADVKMAISRLKPSKIFPDLCLVKYRVSTSSPECQAFFDQGLGFFYSYVWMEASRSFETAAAYDPDCAMAWWGLSRALERQGKGYNHKDALKKAQDLMTRASHREQLLIKARLQEKGMWPGVGEKDERVKAAVATINELLAIYDDDEEGWYYRAQLDGGSGLFGGKLTSVPFYKALLRVNVLHPGANHELLHFYESYKRPALGWIHAENYIKSSSGIPHALHMQAHLATRLGRWDKTTARSTRAVELERAYHKFMGVTPKEDHQFSHHLQTLLLGLTHDGRFAEARKLKKECQGYGIEQKLPWFRLHLAERDWDEALKIADSFRKKDRSQSAYLRALVFLKKGDTNLAEVEVAVLQQAYQNKRGDKQLELRLWETQGMLMCEQGSVDGGLKLLARLVEKTKDDYSHHAWGNGAAYMETWGTAALQCGRLDIAEEGFLEALAHDPGSVRGALGMQVVCERQGRAAEAARYAELAQRCWRLAASESLLAELDSLRGKERPTASPPASSSRLLPWRLADVLMGAVAQEPCRSGPEPGKRPGPYAAVVCTGPERGAPHCYICDAADRPIVIVFARSLSDPLGKLVQKIDQALVKHKDAELRAWVTLLHEDQSAIDAKVVQWAKERAVRDVPVAVFENLTGPPSYRLAADADVTVLLSVRQRVVANFAFRAGELNDAEIARILRELPSLTKSQAPTQKK